VLVAQEAEIRRITVQSQPGQIVPQDPILKNTVQKIGLVEWLKVKALSSSPSIGKKKKKKKDKTFEWQMASLLGEI
jgi:hypothetical protein